MRDRTQTIWLGKPYPELDQSFPSEPILGCKCNPDGSEWILVTVNTFNIDKEMGSVRTAVDIMLSIESIFVIIESQ